MSAMKEYLANLNDMCVNVMQCEEELLRHVTVTAELEETLSILSESGCKVGCARSLHIFWLSFRGMVLAFIKIW